MEALPEGCQHGTVLRPVLLPRLDGPVDLSTRRVMVVLGRVRKRPEDSEKGRGRLYTVARYLVLTSMAKVTPAEMLSAMNSQDLLGTTRKATSC